jgi:hypothetical protein
MGQLCHQQVVLQQQLVLLVPLALQQGLLQPLVRQLRPVRSWLA